MREPRGREHYPGLRIEQRSAIALVSVHRPEKRNALKQRIVTSLESYFSDVPADVRAVGLRTVRVLRSSSAARGGQAKCADPLDSPLERLPGGPRHGRTQTYNI